MISTTARRITLSAVFLLFQHARHPNGPPFNLIQPFGRPGEEKGEILRFCPEG